MTDSKKPTPNIFWPAITDLKSATDASDTGYGAALLVAGATAIFATIALFAGKPILGFDAWAHVDAALFAIIAWRIRKRSRVFAVLGLLLFIAEKLLQFSDGPPATGGAVLAVFITLWFVSGVRGTFAVHRYRAVTAEPAVPPVAPAPDA